ncbi:uncharacterized protein FIBRA_08454 [Fibroporia radiculosa]|uniref:RING-type domain-containing protein n=1 Tax=Fibroporia radiculosa TaxID=599839 RepID=J4GWU1_9APHY|nr:uncharacterized protein FIBRA_08454 [Fibroporia radiculosa]CCM06210.1 predicted protein [Fibroporia radiculosa]
MPATRSRQSSRQAHQSHFKATTPSSPPDPDPDLIVISSDDEASTGTKRHPKTKSRKAEKRKQRTSIPSSVEIVEISSDDSVSSIKHETSTSTIKSLQKQLNEAKKEVQRLKAVQPSSLEDHISCEICTLKLWTPYVLPCGHSFCQTCLQDWFNTTLAQHMTSHPDYNQPALAPYRTALQNPGLPQQTRLQIQMHITQLESRQPRPQYTCPTCRSLVKTKPVEVYALKHLVRTIAGSMGETSPKKPASSRGRTASARPDDGLWDGFFPRTS